MSDEDVNYPGVETAFTFVQPSYQFVLSRFEAADNRLSALLTLVVTVTLGVPLFAKSVNPNADFASNWFTAGILAFLVAAIFGIVGRITGSVTLVNPTILYNEWLDKEPWTFKKDAVFRAGEHFSRNKAAVALKGTYATVVTVAVLLEAAFFTIWLTR